MCGEPPKAGVGRAVGFMLAPLGAGFPAMLTMGSVLRNSLYAPWAFRSDSRSKPDVERAAHAAPWLRFSASHHKPPARPTPALGGGEVAGFHRKNAIVALFVSDDSYRFCGVDLVSESSVSTARFGCCKSDSGIGLLREDVVLAATCGRWRPLPAVHLCLYRCQLSSQTRQPGWYSVMS